MGNVLWQGKPGEKVWKLGLRFAPGDAGCRGDMPSQDIDHVWTDDGDHVGHIIDGNHGGKIRVVGDFCTDIAAQIADFLNTVKPETVDHRKTVASHMPGHWKASEYSSTPAWKLRDIKVNEVHRIHDKDWKPWPGKHRHVCFWLVLENGKAIGWNEGPQGWSFPVITYKAQ